MSSDTKIAGTRKVSTDNSQECVDIRQPPAELPHPIKEIPNIPGYELSQELGRGGMGVVFKGVHLGLNREVALKFLLGGNFASPEVITRFLSEAQFVARMKHPNIVQVFDSGTFQGVHYFAQEFLTGGSLTQRISKIHDFSEVAELLISIAEGVQAIHSLGIIHRDLKPANILFDGEGRPKITDFGLALELEDQQRLTQTGMVVGTPQYMAPEQMVSRDPRLDHRVDIYALGVMMYELMTQRLPFNQGSALEIMHKVLEDSPARPRTIKPAIPHDLETICLKCLEKKPDNRYKTAGHLATDLRRYLEDLPISIRPISTWEHFTRWCKRNQRVAVIAASLVAFFILGFVSVSWSLYIALEANREKNLALEATSLALADQEIQRQRAENSEQYALWERSRASIITASIAFENHNVPIARNALDSIPPRFRSWEWYHFFQQLDQSIADFGKSSGHSYLAEMTPDGQFVLFADQQTQKREVWHAPTRCLVSDWHLPWGLTPLSISSDGKFIVDTQKSRADDSSDVDVCLIDSSTGRILDTFRGPPLKFLHVDPLCHKILFGFSNNSLSKIWDRQKKQVEIIKDKRLTTFLGHGLRWAVSHELETDKLHVWDLRTHQIRHSFLSPWKAYLGMNFNFEENRLALVGGANGVEVVMWDIDKGSRIAHFKGLDNQIRKCKFSPDGKRYVTSGLSAEAKLWDGQTGAAVAVLQGHRGYITDVAFSPDSQLLLTCSHDLTMRIWQTATGKLVDVLLGHTGSVKAAAFTPDSQQIVSADESGTLRIWDAKIIGKRGVLQGHTSFVYGLAFHPDGERVVSGDWDGIIRLWDVTTGRELAEWSNPGGLMSLAIQPSGRHLGTLSRDNFVRLWDLETKQQTAAWSLPVNPRPWVGSRLAFSPNQNWLAVGAGDGTIRRWDITTGQEKPAWADRKCVLTAVAFSPDGRWLASGGEDNTIKILDCTKDTTLVTLIMPFESTIGLSFSPKGRYLASGGLSGKVLLWDTNTWELIGELANGAKVYDVAFTLDETRLFCACSNHRIQVWDVEKREQIVSITGHRDYVYSLNLSPDGTRLASSSGDKTVRIWDTIAIAERLKGKAVK